MSSYEELRKKNIEDNKRILAELGLLNPLGPARRVVQVKRHVQKRKREDPCYEPDEEDVERMKKKKAKKSTEDLGCDFSTGRRRSSRIKGEVAPEVKDEVWEEIQQTAAETERARRKSLADRPYIYGAISGVEIGMWWSMRIHCNHDNIHRPPVAGIHSGPDGAYSIALSGGYEDDIDMGDCFTYTGEGGRDLTGTSAQPKNLRTAPQSKDQALSRGNASLVRSSETGNPVRVIRGFKSRSDFAPADGYRYDGLYKVEKYWYTTGLAGFGVYKFALKRIEDQPPPPWEIIDTENNNELEPALSQDSGFGSQSNPNSQKNPDEKDKSKVEKDESKDENVEAKDEKDESKDEKVESKDEKEESKDEKEESKDEKVESEDEKDESKDEKLESKDKKDESKDETDELKVEMHESKDEKKEKSKVDMNESKDENKDSRVENAEVEMDDNEKKGVNKNKDSSSESDKNNIICEPKKNFTDSKEKVLESTENLPKSDLVSENLTSPKENKSTKNNVKEKKKLNKLKNKIKSDETKNASTPGKKLIQPKLSFFKVNSP